MRAIWKGSIAFGLVHIPVNLYPATETQSISSNLLHKKDHSRIRYQRVSEATGKEVPAEEIVRGYGGFANPAQHRPNRDNALSNLAGQGRQCDSTDGL
jgi:non-homologous end joining protein Ku